MTPGYSTICLSTPVSEMSLVMLRPLLKVEEIGKELERLFLF